MVDKEMLDAMSQLLSPIIEEQRHIRVLLEHTDKRVDALAEGQKGMNEQFQKLDKVAEDVEDIKQKVTALENVTRDNTTEIKQLRAIKETEPLALWVAVLLRGGFAQKRLKGARKPGVMDIFVRNAGAVPCACCVATRHPLFVSG